MIEPAMSRRTFLAGLACTAAFGASPTAVLGGPAWAEFWAQPRSLWLRRGGTGEELRAVYFADGALRLDAYEKISRVLRDVHTGAAVYMDPRLLDLLFVVHGYQVSTSSVAPIVVTNGFESVTTNRRLVATHGASKASRHMTGQAVDISNPEVSGEILYRYMQWVGGGGVGHYPQSKHLHIDTGPRRHWIARRLGA